MKTLDDDIAACFRYSTFQVHIIFSQSYIELSLYYTRTTAPKMMKENILKKLARASKTCKNLKTCNFYQPTLGQGGRC